MAAVVCTDTAQLIGPLQILNGSIVNYRWSVAGALQDDKVIIEAYAAATINELDGAWEYFNYVDPNATQPFVVGQLTILGALMDKAIVDSVQFRYTVQAINTVQVLTNYRMSLLYGDATAHTNNLYYAAVGHADANYYAAVGYAAARVAAAVNYTQALHNAAVAHTNALYYASLAHANGLYNAAVAHSNSLYNSSVSFTRTAATDLQGQVNAINARIASLAGLDVPALTKEITAVANQAAAEVKNAVATAESFATTAAGGAVTAAVAKALTTVQPQIDAIKTETDECLTPLCDTVTPNARQLGNLGKLLSGLTDVGILGLVAALLDEAAHHPGQVVADVESDLAGLVHDAAAGIHDLIGV